MMEQPMTPSDAVDQLLESEKEDTRRWLRYSMDSLVDPLVDELFGKLKIKLLACLIPIEPSSDSPEQTIIPGDSRAQLCKEAVYQATIQTTNSQLISSDNFLKNVQLSQIGVDLSTSRNDNNSEVNFSYIINPRSVITSTNVHRNVINSFDPTEMHHASTSNSSNQAALPILATKSSPSKSFAFHRQDCECDQCLNDRIVKISNQLSEDNDDDDQEVFEAFQEDNSGDDSLGPTKKQRTDGGQVKNNEQVITLSVKCFYPNCTQIFLNKDQLNDHLLKGHSVGQFRCVLKNCHQSFTVDRQIGKHLKEAHLNVTEWQCDRCPKSFANHKVLYGHTVQFHHEGRFTCSFPRCGFTGDCRGKVYGHYRRQHKDHVCDFDRCGQRFENATYLKAHKRCHLGIAPYKCKWPGCGYANYARKNTLSHIQCFHLKKHGDTKDPKDYLDVRQDLLQQGDMMANCLAYA